MRRLAASLLSLLAMLLAAGCQDTVDSLGSDEAGVLHPVPTMPASQVPNPLRDVLGQNQAAITTKINSVYTQLFHDPTQAIYSMAPGTTDQAFIFDVLHSQIRTEGMGLGMMIEVELGQPGNHAEFDNLWRYAKNQLQVMAGPNAGYFQSYCDSADQMSSSMCLDPYGLQQFLTALIFAHDHWGTSVNGDIDYQADALAILHTMRFKEEDNARAGLGSTVTNTFEATSNLPYSFPDLSSDGQTRPSIVMPGYYEIWAKAANDPAFHDAAVKGRDLWKNAAHPTTGLTPIRSTFDGKPVNGWAVFDPESYRTQINMVIDQYWTGGAPTTTGVPNTNVSLCNQILAFFTAQGINNYGTAYSIDGATCTNTFHEPSLVDANAIAAGITTNADQKAYLNALWTQQLPIGNGRYYNGILQLLGLMILGGQFVIY
jgi:oligosaccharide reducing-end xylanase